MKQKIYIILFCMFLILPVCLSFIFKDSNGMENRNLAAFPEIKSGPSAFLQGMNTYINDRIPFKSSIVKLVSKLETINKEDYETDLGILGKDNWMFYKGDDGKSSINDYLGLRKPDEAKLNSMKVNLEKLNGALKARGANLVVLICPNKEDVFEEYMPDKYNRVGNDEVYSKLVYSYLKNDFENILYPVYPLEKTDSFYKYDTHWNDIGAYAAVVEIENLLKLSSVPMNKVKITEGYKEGGDLFSILRLDEADYDKDIYYQIQTDKNIVAKEIENIQTKNSIPYRSFTTNSDNKQNLYAIGDSFLTSMVPYLLEDFGKVTAVHRGDIDMLNVQNITKGDTVLVEIVARYADSLDDILNNVYMKLEGDK